MPLWSDAPRIASPGDLNSISEVLGYVKNLANTVALMAKDLEFIVNGNLDVNNISANSITAEKIVAGAVTASKIDVDELSAISANLGHITAGLVESIQIFGSYIATRNGDYPRAEMSNTSNAFRAYFSEDYYVSIESNLDGTPLITLVSPWNVTTIHSDQYGASIQTDKDLTIRSQIGNIILDEGMEGTGSNIVIRDFTSIFSTFDGESIGSALNQKATSGISTSLSGSANGGIPIGTQLMVNGGGTVTWTGIPSHSHAQN